MSPRRSSAPPSNPDTAGFRRLYIGKGHIEQTEGGASMTYRPGDFYLVPDELAARLIDEDKAYAEGEPPTCETCGTVSDVFVLEGGDRMIGPKELLARHVAGNHPEIATPPSPATPPSMESA